MSDGSDPLILSSPHFTLEPSSNAFGNTIRLRGTHYPEILLLQPYNAWADQHWLAGSHDALNHRALLILLESAYEKGHRAAQLEIQKALGLHGK